MKKIIYLAAASLIFLQLNLRAEEIKQWKWPGGDPSGLDSLQAIDSLRIPPADVKAAWRELVKKQPGTPIWIPKGMIFPELLFGGKKIINGKRIYKNWGTTRCTWESIDSLLAWVWTKPFNTTLEKADSIWHFRSEWTYIRFDTCGNATWDLTRTQRAEKKNVEVIKKPLEEKPPEEVTIYVKRKRWSLRFIGEASHWNKDQNWISYEEVKLGLRVGWRPRAFWKLRTEVDFWPLMVRIHSVNNGASRSIQWPLAQVQSKISLQPSRNIYLFAADALCFNFRSRYGLDSNTGLVMGQLYLYHQKKINFDLMLQPSVSTTLSWPRYVGFGEKFPESLAEYKEIKLRLQLFSFNRGKVRCGLESTWFSFQKTAVDSSLKLTNQLQYISTGRPVFGIGGPYVQFRLPWKLIADLSVTYQHIDSERYEVQGNSAVWVPGDNNEVRFNFVMVRGFSISSLGIR